MANCFGTNDGQIFNRFVLNDDGTVTGEFNDNTSASSYGSLVPLNNGVNLPSDCCSALGYNYDISTGKCFYKNPCDDNDGVKVLFGLDQNDAAYFPVSDEEQSTLEVKLDYMFGYDCQKLLTCANEKETALTENIGQLELEITDYQITISGYTNHLNSLLAAPVQDGDAIAETEGAIAFLEASLLETSGSVETLQAELAEVQDKPLLTILSDFNATLVIDRLVPTSGGTGSGFTYDTVTTFPLLSIGDFEEYLIDRIDSTTGTGISMSGDDCDAFNNAIKIELGENCDLITETTFNPCWLSGIFEVKDTALVDLIKNQNIHISVQIEEVKCDMSILLDRIEVNKITTVTETNEVFVAQCPGFNLTRVLDNKKSWNRTESFENRQFDLATRETDYDLSDSRLVINTKELDLNVDPSGAIECNVYEYVKNNIDCFLTGSTTNFDELLTTELSGTTTKENFINAVVTELIDAKTRKTLSAYPTLIKFFELYQGIVPSDCPDSNKLGYKDLDSFIDLLGTYWIDLIEQFVPATTLWGATNVYRSTAFHQDKYKYTPNTIDWGCSGSTSGGTASGTIISGSTSYGNYSSKEGTRFYGDSIMTEPGPFLMDKFTAPFNGYDGLKNAVGTTITDSVLTDNLTQPIWGSELGDPDNPSGRFEEAGVNFGTVSTDVTYEATINYNNTSGGIKKFYIGFGGISNVSLFLNGTEIINSPYGNTFGQFQVIPLQLLPGVNEFKITTFTDSLGGIVPFGMPGFVFEIYDTTVTNLVNVPDLATLATYTEYTTKDIRDGFATLDFFEVGASTSPVIISPNYQTSVGAEVIVHTLDTSNVCGIVDTNPETYDNLCLKKVDFGAEYLGSFTIEDI